jgi:hypothetical protein
VYGKCLAAILLRGVQPGFMMAIRCESEGDIDEWEGKSVKQVGGK